MALSALDFYFFHVCDENILHANFLKEEALSAGLKLGEVSYVATMETYES
jgi:hypothetical protein